jgi:hypothetical protein
MTIGARIVVVFFGFLIAEQGMLAIADWQLTRPAALAVYVAEADFLEVNEKSRAMGGGSYQSCDYKRSIFLYRGLICFAGFGAKSNEIYIHYWQPHGLLNPFAGSYFKNLKTRSAKWGISKETGTIRELN